MNNITELVYVIIAAISSCAIWGIFVTPIQLSNKLEQIAKENDAKYVHQDVYNVEIRNLNGGVSDIKEKVDKIYDKIMGVA